MADAIVQFDQTTGSKVVETSDNADPPTDWPIHPLVNEGYPPGDKSDWFLANSINNYVWMRVHPEDVPADFDRTGDEGFEITHYHSTIKFLADCAIEITGFVGGVAVTNARRFLLAGTNKAARLQFPATVITANWDGSKGYLTKAQFEQLELRGQFKNGGPGDIDPPTEN